MNVKASAKKVIVVGSKRVAAHAPGRGALDPAVSVPVVTAGRPGALRLVRRADLLPHSIPKALVGAVALGDTLLDVFSPRYGSWFPQAAPLFDFLYSHAWWTDQNGWQLNRGVKDAYAQSLRFRIRSQAQAAYMRVEFGQNTDIISPRSILTVRIDGTSFQADIGARSFSFLDVVLPSGGAVAHEVEFSLDAVPSGQPRVLASIDGIGLFRSIRAFPEELLTS